MTDQTTSKLYRLQHDKNARSRTTLYASVQESKKCGRDVSNSNGKSSRNSLLRRFASGLPLLRYMRWRLPRLAVIFVIIPVAAVAILRQRAIHGPFLSGRCFHLLWKVGSLRRRCEWTGACDIRQSPPRLTLARSARRDLHGFPDGPLRVVLVKVVHCAGLGRRFRLLFAPEGIVAGLRALPVLVGSRRWKLWRIVLRKWVIRLAV